MCYVLPSFLFWYILVGKNIWWKPNWLERVTERQSKKVRKRVWDLYRKCIHLIPGPMILRELSRTLSCYSVAGCSLTSFFLKKHLTADGSSVKGITRSCAYNAHNISRGSVGKRWCHVFLHASLAAFECECDLTTVVRLFALFQHCWSFHQSVKL